MVKECEIGIIIQARFSSTRLPGKLFLPFYKSKRLIDVFLEGIIKTVNNKYNIILATSTNIKDNLFKDVASNYGIELFRGDENDVLKRTTDAARYFGFSTVVRVCADNPIYDIERTLGLLAFHKKNNADYTAFCLSGEIPSIKSHLGLWGEIVETKALLQAERMTADKIYHEHVTNFLYGNPEKFIIQLIDAPPFLFNRDDIRLTVDTMEDFNMMKDIYSRFKIMDSDIDIHRLIRYIDQNPAYLENMRKQIERNKK